MPILFEFVQNYLQNSDKPLTYSKIPMELRKKGGVFYALNLQTIYALLKGNSKLVEVLRRNSEELLEFTLKKFRDEVFQNAANILLLSRVNNLMSFACTDAEFQYIKAALPFTTKGHSKKSFTEFVNSRSPETQVLNYNERAVGLKKVEFAKPSTILYEFMYLLLNSSDNKEYNIILNEMVLNDYEKLEEVLNDLKTTERRTKDGKLLPQLDNSTTAEELKDAVNKLIVKFNLQPSLIPQKLVKFENGKMSDLGELTLLNHVVVMINEEKQRQAAEVPEIVKFVKAFAGNNNLAEINNIEIPLALKSLSGPFYGVKKSTIYAVILLLQKMEHNYCEATILTLIDECLEKFENSLVDRLFNRLNAAEVFECTVAEFETLKKAARFNLGYQNATDFCASINQNKAMFYYNLHLLSIDSSSTERYEESENPLYNFVYKLINASDSSAQDFKLNEDLLKNSYNVNCLLQDLQHNKRETPSGKKIALLHWSVDAELFAQVLKDVISEKIIRSSITPNRLVRSENGKMQDLNELTLQNYLVTKLNKIAEQKETVNRASNPTISLKVSYEDVLSSAHIIKSVTTSPQIIQLNIKTGKSLNGDDPISRI